MTIRKATHLTFIIIIISAVYSMGQEKNTMANAKPGIENDKSLSYFKLGDLRLINNNWGSKDMNCEATYKIFIKDDKTFGWKFNRANCNDGGTRPDYPEVEFGIHPFSIGSHLATSPEFLSTDVLPIQIKDIKSASVTPVDLKIELNKEGSWNLNFEMWFTDQHPVTGNHKNAYAELIAFWGWQDGRWPCGESGTFKSGGKNYRLCHQSDNWGGWRYYQFRMEDGPKKSFNGKFDVKAALTWLVDNAGFSQDLWISRFEIGTEIGDNTSGMVTMKDVIFEVNGVSRSAEFFKKNAVTTLWKNNSKKVLQSHKTTFFPAFTYVKAIDLHGKVSILFTGKRSMTAAELSYKLSSGIYFMHFTGGRGYKQSNKAIIVLVVK